MTARVVVRQDDGTELDITDLALEAADIADDYSSHLDGGELSVIAALVIAIGSPYAVEFERQLQWRAEEVARAAVQRQEYEALQAHLDAPVTVTLAHLARVEGAEDHTQAGTTVTIRRREAMRLDQGGRLVRPNIISPQPVEPLAPPVARMPAGAVLPGMPMVATGGPAPLRARQQWRTPDGETVTAATEVSPDGVVRFQVPDLPAGTLGEVVFEYADNREAVAPWDGHIEIVESL